MDELRLIKSISGFRGIIGGVEDNGLTPLDVVKFTAAFAEIVREKVNRPTIVIGRDARISGEMVNYLTVGTLMACGCDVVDLGLSTTPTVEMAVTNLHADGGIILTASHNPAQWNALKLLNEKGEFISAETGKKLLETAADARFVFSPVEELGSCTRDNSQMDRHVQAVLGLPLVDKEAVSRAGFTVVVDAVNSTGALALPMLLEALGVKKVVVINGDVTGRFAHDPEPLPKNLTGLSAAVIENRAHVGFSVDPDVDRLAIINEDGSMFGEEYTLVAVADYILQHTPGNTVSNLSSTRALRDVTEKHGNRYEAAAVGEVNVVEKMKATNAIIGGEGNGGIIYPALHYGRDALVGIALFLTHLAKSGLTTSGLRATYPEYFISKMKLDYSKNLDIDAILKEMQGRYRDIPHSTVDGLKIDFPDEWVHLRKSNTEPIIRIYSESRTERGADALATRIKNEIEQLISRTNG